MPPLDVGRLHPVIAYCQGDLSSDRSGRCGKLVGACADRDGPGCGRPSAARRRRSVSRILSPRPTSGGSSHSSGPAVARGIERPTRGNGRATRARPEDRASLLLGLAPGGVYRASVLTNGPGELLPHRFTLAAGHAAGAVSFCGTFPRSLGAAVNGHPALWSPDFPPAACATSGCSTSSGARHAPVAGYSLASSPSGCQNSMRWQLGQRITCSLRWI